MTILMMNNKKRSSKYEENDVFFLIFSWGKWGESCPTFHKVFISHFFSIGTFVKQGQDLPHLPTSYLHFLALISQILLSLLDFFHFLFFYGADPAPGISSLFTIIFFIFTTIYYIINGEVFFI